MSVDRGIYAEIEFSRVQEYEVGGVHVLVGRVTTSMNIGPVLYAAALDEDGLHNRRLRGPRVERAFGTTTATAVAALFNLME
jgi:hypothetical protein